MSEQEWPEKLDDLIALRVTQKSHTEQAAKLEKEERRKLNEIDDEIMRRLDMVGSETGAGAGHSISIVEEDVPDNTNWEEFIPFLLETGNMHLVQRRISSTAWREYKQIYGQYPPGTVPRKRRTLSVTKRQSRKKASED